MRQIVALAKIALPARALRELQYWRHRLRRGQAARNGVAEAFSTVYATKAWGDDGGDFFSGPGTVNPDVTQPYLEYLRAEFAAYPTPPRVLDLGCGDFKLGLQLLPSVSSFTGVDVVPGLIERNTRMYGADNVKFHCADIANDPLPPADIVLVREVMQHMSNAQVQRLLSRLSQYPVAYVTNVEHPNDGAMLVNRDLVPGPDTREVFGSGLFLDASPFNFESEIVLSRLIKHDEHAVATMTTRKHIRRAQ